MVEFVIIGLGQKLVPIAESVTGIAVKMAAKWAVNWSQQLIHTSMYKLTINKDIISSFPLLLLWSTPT